MFSQKFTKSVKDMLPHLTDFKQQLNQEASVEAAEENEKASKRALRLIIHQHFIWDQRYKSDFSQEFYQAQGAVTPIVTGSGDQDDSSFKQ